MFNPLSLLLALLSSASGLSDAPQEAAHQTLSYGDTLTETWVAPGPDGHPASWYRQSLDRGRSWGRPRSTTHDLMLRYAQFDPLVEEPEVPSALSALPGHGLYVVQYVAKGLAPWREAIRALGATDHRFLAWHANIWAMDASTAEAVAQLPFVRWVGAFHPAYKLEDELMAMWSGGELPAWARYNIVVGEWGPSQKGLVAGVIHSMGGSVEMAVDEGWRMEATLTPEQLVQLLQQPEVLGVDRWSSPETDMDNIRDIMGGNYVETVGGFTGTGVRAEVMDSGLDSSHPDWPAPRTPIMHGSNGSYTSHGTSTFGINFSIGATHSKARGMMPSAQGVFASYNFSNRYTHTAQCVNPSLNYKCVYQTNSWGNSRTLSYNSYSQEMDDLILLNDFQILQSQSNAGDQYSRPQAWAKNVLAIGAVYHYDDQNDSNDKWNWGASIGPAADGRIKPDMSAFYDSILTSAWPGNSYTTSFGGTSGATPIVAGHLGLIHEMWHNGIFGNPTAATVFESRPHCTLAKALIINSAEQYAFSGTSHDRTRTHQGWGRPDLRYLYDNRASIFYVDESDVLRDMESKSYTVAVPSGASEFRATLVYIDPAGTTSASLHRVNDLSLKVTSPAGTVYWGNNGLLTGNYSSPGGTSNTKDTVENVLLQNPATGNWTVEVIADEVNADTHGENGTAIPDVDYALVVSPVTVSGGGGTDSIQLVGPTQVWPGVTVDFTWSLAPAYSDWWFAYSLSGNGSNMYGHTFDLGQPVTIAATGSHGATGSDTFQAVIPSTAAGMTIYIEVAALSGGQFSDSNMIGMVVH